MVIKEEKENIKRFREVFVRKMKYRSFQIRGLREHRGLGVAAWIKVRVGHWGSETPEEHLLGPSWCFSFKGLMHSPRTSPLSVELDPLSTLKMR